jgi:GT2 family glycosyltransferase
MKFDTPYVSIVIASYNRNAITQESIISALNQNYPDNFFEVIVVDNNSFDGTVEEIKNNFSDYIKSDKLKVVPLKYNSGSSGSYVECLRHMNKDWKYMLKMDEDVILESSCLQRMIEVASEDHSITMVGGKVFYKRRPEVIQAIGSKLRSYYAIAKGIGINNATKDAFNEQQDLDGLNGCMVLISRKIYDTIGWFDTDYFLYYDDHDLMYKSLKYGYRHVYTPHAVGYHDTGTGSKKKYSQRLWLYYSTRGSLLFLRKNFGPYTPGFWIYFLVHNIKFFAGFFFIFQHTLTADIFRNLKLYFLAYKHGFQGRGGYFDIDSSKLKVAIFSGGRGSSQISKGLRELGKESNRLIEINHITNAYDDGKSTGKVRQIFDNSILGPSDVRKIQETQYLAFFDDDNVKSFFNYRFNHDKEEAVKLLNFLILKDGDAITDNNFELAFFYKLPIELKEHSKSAIQRFLSKISDDVEFLDFSLTNIIYAGLADIHGDLNAAEQIIKQSLSLPDSVYLNSSENKYIFALSEDGLLLSNEAEIVDYSGAFPIYGVYFADQPLSKKTVHAFNQLNEFNEKKLFLKSINNAAPRLNKNTKEIIEIADIVIFAPGTQYSSLYPTYLTEGIGNVLSRSNATKVFITNISHDNETPDFSAADQVKQAIYHLNNKDRHSLSVNCYIDALVVNMPQTNDPRYIRPNLIELESLGVDEIVLNNYESLINSTGYHNGELIAQTIFNLHDFRWRNK